MFAAAFVLTLGMTQCKKDNNLNAPANEGHTVHITVNVGDGGSKGTVNPATGEIGFASGDELYVGYNNAYVGTLTYTSGAFSGDLTLSESGTQKLHFYYFGGSLTPTVDGTTYTVDLSDRTGNTSGVYPVISYGTSTKNYASSVSSYTTTLLNQCALVKSDVVGLVILSVCSWHFQLTTICFQLASCVNLSSLKA